MVVVLLVLVVIVGVVLLVLLVILSVKITLSDFSLPNDSNRSHQTNQSTHFHQSLLVVEVLILILVHWMETF